MTDFNELADELSGLVIFRSLLKDPVVEPLAGLIRSGGGRKAGGRALCGVCRGALCARRQSDRIYHKRCTGK